MQTQRTILWIIFSMSLLFLWDSWQRSQGRASFFGPAPATQTAPAGGGANGRPASGAVGDASIPTAPAPAPGAGAAGSAASTAVPGAPAAQTGGKKLTVTTDVLKVDIDTLGAQVERAELLRHREAEDQGSGFWEQVSHLFGARNPADSRHDENVVLLRNEPGRIYVAQSGLIGAPPGDSFPTHRTPFEVVQGPTQLAPGADQIEVKLAATNGGLRVVRTYTFTRDSYVIGVKDEVSNVGVTPLKPTLYMQLTRDSKAPAGGSQFYSTYTGPVVYTDKAKFQKVDFSSIEKGKPDFEKQASDGWVGIIQHYFLSAWIPPEQTQREFFTRKVGEDLYSVGALQPLPELAPNASAVVDSRLLVAPQDQRMLAAIAPGLDLAVDYGWLTVIAKPIFWLLQALHSLVNNWGWAIVLLTIVIKTIFFPLQAASYKSMARMKAVTPRMMQIRERYGSDRAKMNQAMMELYKNEKINPLGGCLPIVVQIPVFIALYWVLLASVEMRNAPWIGWIHDLAAPDPYFILPLVMAATMFLQTKLNPTPPDPVQAKMMTIMPLVFSVMFFFFPAGLVLYWLVNNCYSIAQQWVITRKIEGKPVFARAAR